MLDGFPVPKLRVYPRYTVVAEKLEALISLGVANSRMKDYFDLWVLARHSDFEGEVLRQAIGATLSRRGTDIPTVVPFGLTEAFATDAQKQIEREEAQATQPAKRGVVAWVADRFRRR